MSRTVHEDVVFSLRDVDSVMIGGVWTPIEIGSLRLKLWGEDPDDDEEWFYACTPVDDNGTIVIPYRKLDAFHYRGPVDDNANVT